MQAAEWLSPAWPGDCKNGGPLVGGDHAVIEGTAMLLCYPFSFSLLLRCTHDDAFSHPSLRKLRLIGGLVGGEPVIAVDAMRKAIVVGTVDRSVAAWTIAT